MFFTRLLICVLEGGGFSQGTGTETPFAPLQWWLPLGRQFGRRGKWFGLSAPLDVVPRGGGGS